MAGASNIQTLPNWAEARAAIKHAREMQLNVYGGIDLYVLIHNAGGYAITDQKPPIMYTYFRVDPNGFVTAKMYADYFFVGMNGGN